MAIKTLEELAGQLKKIDFCMLCTGDGANKISARPMSNNGEVEYDGDSWFFSYENTDKVTDIRRNSTVTLTFTAPPHLFGKPGIFISVKGEAAISRDKAQFNDHWSSDLDRWFPEGIDTRNMVMIKVSARSIEYWDGEENEIISLTSD